MKFIHFFWIFGLCAFSANAQQISPNLVGTNAWYTDPSDEVWNLTAESGVQSIRIGGHAFDDNVPSKADLLSWVKEIQAMGAEPILQVSQYESPEKAAELVRFFNIESSGEIAPIKYWNIGNEPWLQNGKPDLSTVGGMIETYFKPRAEAMKEVDPSIKIYGPDLCYYIEEAVNDLFGGDNDIAGKIPGKDYYYCDGISWHRYPQDDNINLAYEGIEDFKDVIIKTKQKVDQINADYNRTGDDALQWGIGEYNAKGGSVVHSWENGQMFGGILGLCMKYEANYATSWSMFENGGNRQGTDFSFIDGKNMTPRASYRHMEFVAKYFKGQYVDGQSSSNDFVVYGAQNEEQTAVMVMHRAEGGAKEYSLHLNNTTSTGEAYELNVDAGLTDSYSDIIAPRATQVMIFRGDSIIKINYTSEDFDKEMAPVYSSFKVASELPAKPANLESNPVSFSSIELNWIDQSEYEQGFLLEREGINGFELLTVLPPNTTSYSDIELESETSYSYRIRAYNSLGKSEYTAVTSSMTPEPPASVAYNGPHEIPGTIQAEDFNNNEAGVGYQDEDNDLNKGEEYRETGVDVQSRSQGGFNVGYINEGEWLKYLIADVTPDTYDVSFSIASDNTTVEKRIDLSLGGNVVGSVEPYSTGDWQEWETITLENVEIASAEPIEMRLDFYGGSFNLDWILFVKTGDTSSRDMLFDRMVNAVYNRQIRSILIEANQDPGKSVISVINMNGQSIYKSKYSGRGQKEISTSGWACGIYLLSIVSPQGQFTRKLHIAY
jgi:hypothetical protein